MSELVLKCGHQDSPDNVYRYKNACGYSYVKCKTCMVERNRRYRETIRGKQVVKNQNHKWYKANKERKAAYEKERLKDPVKAAKNRYSHRISARNRSIVKSDMAYWYAVKKHRRQDSFDDGLYTVNQWELEHPEFVFTYKGNRRYETLGTDSAEDWRNYNL